MKRLILLSAIILGIKSFAQQKQTIHSVFKNQLKAWTKTIKNFQLSDFIKDTSISTFESNSPTDLSELKEFLKTYKPLLAYNTDSTKFIDIYSYQLTLEKKKSYYQANVDIDQTIMLYDKKAKYWNRIKFFTTISEYIEEAVWINDNEFILAGISNVALEG